MKPVLLTCKKASIGYKGRNGQTLITDFDFDLHAGEVVGLIGRNGAGKSSLLRSLAGLQPLLAGHIERLPQPMLEENFATPNPNPNSNSPTLAMASDPVKVLPTSTSHPGIAWVTPLRSYPREMTGWELVALGRHPHTAWHGHLSEEDEKQITAALHVCGATELAYRSLAQMSDGERQRLCIARGIAQEARILLLDEPTAFLDAPGRMSVFRLAKKQAHQENRAVILSTHDLDLACRGCDRILILRKKKQILVGKPGDSVFDAEMKAEFEAEELL